MKSLGIIKPEDTVFVMVDIQERLAPVIHNIAQVISNSNILIKSSRILDIPLIVTEQYPRGLGKTCGEIKFPENFDSKDLIEKTHFSCFGCDEFVKKLNETGARSIVLFGIEAHVCILKTALDALENNFDVHVVADAAGSRTPENLSTAIERMRQSGAFIVSTEMIIFQLIEKSATVEFKMISKLVK